MKTIEESLLILRKLALDIGFRTDLLLKGEIFKVLEDEKVGSRTTLFTTLVGMNIIDTCSYLYEYENIFGIKTESEYHDRIILIKSICKPAIKQIKEWSDLNNIRNWLLAHNLRINKGKMIYNQTLLDYNVPTTIHEVELLASCIQIINHIIVHEFYNEIDKISDKKIAMIKEKEFFKKEQCWGIIDKMVDGINSKINEKGKSYLINLH